jgi:hypothetical protein
VVELTHGWRSEDRRYRGGMWRRYALEAFVVRTDLEKREWLRLRSKEGSDGAACSLGLGKKEILRRVAPQDDGQRRLGAWTI